MKRVLAYLTLLLFLLLFSFNPTQADTLGFDRPFASYYFSDYRGGGLAFNTLGPVGGPGGTSFSDEGLVIPYERVSGVLIRSGAYLDQIALIVTGFEGTPQPLPRHGGNGGVETRIDFGPDEYILGISGRYDSTGFIHSIAITTNQQTYGPYGDAQGSGEYNFQVPAANEVAGFVGRSGAYVDALGVVYRYRPTRDIEGEMDSSPAPTARPATSGETPVPAVEQPVTDATNQEDSTPESQETQPSGFFGSLLRFLGF
jgi:hypothetical protein